jgi:hypothetical protein
MKFYIAFFIVFVFGSGYDSAQASSVDSIKISILTCAPGDQLYSIYGHNAIRVNNAFTATDLVYNYGTFDFSTPGFAIKFMRGKLPYMLSMSDFSDFLGEYYYFKRNVTEQVLHLDSLSKLKILHYLEVNMRPENRAYKYDFFMDNCATRLRDILVTNVPNLTWDQSWASGKTFRQIIKEYQKSMPWTNFGIDLIIGSPADSKTTLLEESFIPEYLSTALEHAVYTDANRTDLQLHKVKILGFDKRFINLNPFISPVFIFCILLLLECFILSQFIKGKPRSWVKYYDILWVILITLSSLLMIIMWFGTDHIPTKNNWNILWASPLIPAWWWGLHSRKSIVVWLAYVIAISLLLSMVNAIPGVQFLPQYFNPIVIIICAILLLKGYRLCKGINKSVDFDIMK